MIFILFIRSSDERWILLWMITTYRLTWRLPRLRRVGHPCEGNPLK